MKDFLTYPTFLLLLIYIENAMAQTTGVASTEGSEGTTKPTPNTNSTKCYKLLSPYSAMIYIDNSSKGKSQILCNAVIVHSHFIITAAHCFSLYLNSSGIMTEKFRVIAGNELSCAFHHEVATVTWHPEYEVEATPHYDVALVQLTHAIQLKNGSRMVANLGNESSAEYWHYIYNKKHKYCMVGGMCNKKENKLDPKHTYVQLMKHYSCMGAFQQIHGFMMTETDFLCGWPTTSYKVRSGAGLFPVKPNPPLLGIYVTGPYTHDEYSKYRYGLILKTSVFRKWLCEMIVVCTFYWVDIENWHNPEIFPTDYNSD